MLLSKCSSVQSSRSSGVFRSQTVTHTPLFRGRARLVEVTWHFPMSSAATFTFAHLVVHSSLDSSFHISQTTNQDPLAQILYRSQLVCCLRPIQNLRQWILVCCLGHVEWWIQRNLDFKMMIHSWQWPSAPTLSMRRRLGPSNTWGWDSWRSKLHNSADPSPSHPGCAPTSSVHLPIKWQDGSGKFRKLHRDLCQKKVLLLRKWFFGEKMCKDFLWQGMIFRPSL